ncbi:fatty acid elongase [Colletotrichum karsti]|uniref:Elongation of fatty acids protein n=1 Tax=Colletotrichum karsti TaxID=1095194 RepID=A0A9P6LL15_9PEZI|nr:fatty acid elongase [Colletotrichum karsti]KAF9876720.1 fatty acid elongase [Colletotrichum karsti]
MSLDNLTFKSHPFAVVREAPSIIFSPWRTFDKVFTSLAGYPTSEFEFVYGHTPLSTLTETLVMVALYLIIIFGGREMMRDRKPMKLNTLFKIHNLFLSLLSGALLVLFIEQVAPSLWQNGLYRSICTGAGWTQPLVVLYYVNYLIKYYELIDTVFLMVKKKPLTFLHCYHHPATVFLCFTQLIGNTPISWVPITLNLLVHVVMYWYYFQTARGVKVWWKEWITRLQITQFVLDLGFVYFVCYDYWADKFHPWLPHLGRCEGELMAAVSGCVILSSYLVLFVMFYIATYKKASSKRAAQKTKSGSSEKTAVSVAAGKTNEGEVKT